VVAFINGSAADHGQEADFRKGLAEAGAIDGQNVRIEFHWLEGQYDAMPALVGEFVRRRVAVIATPGFVPAATAAKAATATIPIVFGVSEDPVKLGLVANFARPGGNATGVNFFFQEVVAKRLGWSSRSYPTWRGSRPPMIRISRSPGSAPGGNLTWCRHWPHSETGRKLFARSQRPFQTANRIRANHAVDAYTIAASGLRPRSRSCGRSRS